MEMYVCIEQRLSNETITIKVHFDSKDALAFHLISYTITINQIINLNMKHSDTQIYLSTSRHMTISIIDIIYSIERGNGKLTMNWTYRNNINDITLRSKRPKLDTIIPEPS